MIGTNTNTKRNVIRQDAISLVQVSTGRHLHSFDIVSKPSDSGNEYLDLDFYELSENRIFRKSLFSIALNKEEQRKFNHLLYEFLLNCAGKKKYMLGDYGYIEFEVVPHTNLVDFRVCLLDVDFKTTVETLSLIRFMRLPR